VVVLEGSGIWTERHQSFSKYIKAKTWYTICGVFIDDGDGGDHEDGRVGASEGGGTR
jgi:hypothetical protein